MPDDAAPTGWRTPDQPDDEMTRYSAQPVTQYEHTEADVGIQLIPSDPQTGSANEEDYRINVISTSADDVDDMEPLANASDHDAALDIARKFMHTYNDRCVEGTANLETIMQEFSEHD